MTRPVALGGTGMTEQAVTEDIIEEHAELSIDTFALIQLWRRPCLVPETFCNQLCVQLALLTDELSIRSACVQDLCPVLVVFRPFPGTRGVAGGRVSTVGVWR